MIKNYKLVRDQIPDLIERDGMIPIYKYIESTAEYEEALCYKLVEEAMELRDTDEFGAAEELCDVYEVIKSLAKLYGYSMKDLEAMAAEKAKIKGGFEKRVKLLGIDQQNYE